MIAALLLCLAWVVVVPLGVLRRPWVRRLMLVSTVLTLDGWLWAIAFDSPLRAHHLLAVPLSFLHLLLAMGAVQAGTGYRTRSDGGFARAAGLMGGSDGLRMTGFDDRRPSR